MSIRLALMGTLIATASVAGPSVAAAQNPWRADPQANGQYMVPPVPQAAPKPLPKPLAQPYQIPLASNAPKYAPLDGDVDREDHGYVAYPGGPGALYGFGSAPGYGSNYGYGGSGLAGPGLFGPGLGGPGFGGLGVPLGYGASPYLGGLGYPGSGWGGYGPSNGWGNNFGGPLSWMPFW